MKIPRNSHYPYYYPTQLLLVDDDILFLDNFSLQFNRNLAVRCFASPQHAADYILETQAEYPTIAKQYLDPRIYQRMSPYHYDPDMEQMLSSHLVEPQRFASVSVAVVDYAMPQMNGLDFCRALKRSPLKKILLTGKATIDLALDAFNDGLIDQFLRKDDPHLDFHIHNAVMALQQRYFSEITSVTATTLPLDTQHLLQDKAFTKYLGKVRHELNIVEYYWTCGGFLLLSRQGKLWMLRIIDPDELSAHYDFAISEQAPQALLDLLLTKEQIPYFPTEDGYYKAEFASCWRRFMHRVDFIPSEQSYCCALVPTEHRAPSTYSYEHYLDTLSRAVA